jgi:heterotetrameric sarcosine oxidase gamma subunit
VAPYRLSPVHDLLDRPGVRWVESDGWRVAASWGDAAGELARARAGVGLADASHQAKLEVQGRHIDAALALLLDGAVAPEVGGGIRRQGGACYRIRPDLALALGAPAAAGLRRLETEPASGCVHTIDRTSGLAAFVLAGPNVREILTRVTSLDLRERSFPDLRCARTAVARVAALVGRRDRGSLPAFDIVVAREYGAYLWRALAEAGHSFGLVEIGGDALRELES